MWQHALFLGIQILWCWASAIICLLIKDHTSALLLKNFPWGHLSCQFLSYFSALEFHSLTKTVFLCQRIMLLFLIRCILIWGVWTMLIFSYWRCGHSSYKHTFWLIWSYFSLSGIANCFRSFMARFKKCSVTELGHVSLSHSQSTLTQPN